MTSQKNKITFAAGTRRAGQLYVRVYDKGARRHLPTPLMRVEFEWRPRPGTNLRDAFVGLKHAVERAGIDVVLVSDLTNYEATLVRGAQEIGYRPFLRELPGAAGQTLTEAMTRLQDRRLLANPSVAVLERSVYAEELLTLQLRPCGVAA
jgi:hypothetical protein